MQHPLTRRIPLPALLLLALLIAAGPIGLALSHDPRHAARPGNTLGDVARTAGCRLHEYKDARVTNPHVTGRRMEQTIAANGSHIGRTTPSIHAGVHALLHGRVLIQYRPGLPEPEVQAQPEPEVQALDRLVRDDPLPASRTRPA